jgi:hypothetical protein
MTVSDQPAFGALMPGYTAGQYLDTSPSFAVYSDKSHLDNGWQVADIYDHFNRDTSKMERDIPRATPGTLSGSLNSYAALMAPIGYEAAPRMPIQSCLASFTLAPRGDKEVL